jgi:hypothetical protein
MRKLAIAAVVCWAGSAAAQTTGEKLVEQLKFTISISEGALDSLADALESCEQEKRPMERDACFTKFAVESGPRARAAAKALREGRRSLDLSYPMGAEGDVRPKKR